MQNFANTVDPELAKDYEPHVGQIEFADGDRSWAYLVQESNESIELRLKTDDHCVVGEQLTVTSHGHPLACNVQSVATTDAGICTLLALIDDALA